MSLIILFLLLKMNSIVHVFYVLGKISIGLSVVVLITNVIVSVFKIEQASIKSFPSCKTLFILGIICLVSSSLLPNRNESLTMAGIYYITNIKGMKDIPENLVAQLNRLLGSPEEMLKQANSGIDKSKEILDRSEKVVDNIKNMTK